MSPLRTVATPSIPELDLSSAVAGLRAGRRTVQTQTRLDTVRRSLRAFCLEYFPHHFTSGFCEMHDDIFAACDTLDVAPHGRRVARIAPRKFGKTTIISMALPIQKIAFHERWFILLIGESSTTAEANLATMAQELETNDKLITDFPHLVPARDARNQTIKWTDRQLVFSNWSTIVARGMGARMRGLKYRQRRPDLAIIDDPESPETADTFLKRARHKRWFGGTFMGLGATNWDIFVIGNLPHHDALIADLVRSPEWDGKLWRAVNIPRRGEERYPLGNTLEDGSALWPEEWSLQRLDAYKLEPNVGNLGFVREMMNDPREDESKHFDMAKFSYFDYTPDRLKTYQMIRTYVDPAGGENPGQMRRGKRDWCAIVTCGRTADGYLDILDVTMTREAPDRQIARVLDVYAAFGSRRIGVEENMWKNLVQPTFANIARSRGLYPSIHTVHTTSNKVQRILSIQPLIEAGVIRFARHLLDKVPDYFAQFDEFPGDFDDGPDATEGVVRMLEISRGSMGTFIPMAHTSYWRNRA